MDVPSLLSPSGQPGPFTWGRGSFLGQGFTNRVLGSRKQLKHSGFFSGLGVVAGFKGVVFGFEGFLGGLGALFRKRYWVKETLEDMSSVFNIITLGYLSSKYKSWVNVIFFCQLSWCLYILLFKCSCPEVLDKLKYT